MQNIAVAIFYLKKKKSPIKILPKPYERKNSGADKNIGFADIKQNKMHM